MRPLLPRLGCVTVLTRYWEYVRPYRWHGLLILVLALMSTTLSLAMPYAIKIVLDEVLLGHRFDLLPMVTGYILIVLLVSTGLGILTNYIYARATGGMLLSLRMEMARHYQRLEAQQYTLIAPGDFISRFLNDVTALQSIITDGIFGFVLNTLSFIVLLVIMSVINPLLALISLLSMPVFLLVSALFGPAVRRAAMQVQEQTAAVTENIQELVEGVRLTRLYGQELSRELILRGVMTEHLRRMIRGGLISHCGSGVVSAVVTITPIAVLWYGTKLVTADKLTPGSLVAFLSYLSAFYGPVTAFSELSMTLQGALAVLQRVTAVFEWQQQDWTGTEQLDHCRGELELRNISFSYGPNSILEELSLKVPAGEAILVVGPSGIGKSTLACVMAGLYTPSTGEVLLDGKPIRRLSRETLTRLVTVVPQDVFLWNDTIENNIRFGETEKPFPEVQAAARQAGAEEFIMATALGYKTVVGTHGHRLSGGQRQRISLARALVRHPVVLILDEATTSVGSMEEMRIQESLQAVRGLSTLIIITHRPESYPWIQHVYELKHGRLSETMWR